MILDEYEESDYWRSLCLHCNYCLKKKIVIAEEDIFCLKKIEFAEEKVILCLKTIEVAEGD